MWFRPDTIGTIVIEAITPDVETAVRFEVVANRKEFVQIRFGPLFDCDFTGDPSSFSATDGKGNINVSVGTVIEFQNGYGSDWPCRARLVATFAPPGGELFDTGEMAPGAVFRFIPSITGIWAFRDTHNGGAGTITVH
jgi:hypothetical protein